MGSDESHFIFSVGSDGQSHKTVYVQYRCTGSVACRNSLSSSTDSQPASGDSTRETGVVGLVRLGKVQSRCACGVTSGSVRIPCVIRTGQVRPVRCGSVQCGSDRYRIYAIGKARMRCTPSLGRLPCSNSCVVCLVDAVPFKFSLAFRPQRPSGLLGTGSSGRPPNSS